ncbi:MAG: VOC family protein [Burkholderiales bacterium]|jgi:catechol 2,3-dioxygenase-like lactoylglutathione lyase family enzyme|nr:VOC family protein [Burkholderiales bacterium]
MKNIKNPKRHETQAVHSLDRVVFTVPDLKEAENYYATFGLEVKKRSNAVDLYTFGHNHCWATILPSAEKKKLQYMVFAAYAEDMALIGERIKQSGYPHGQPHPLGSNEGLWVVHPEGFYVQVIEAEKSSPSAKSEPLNAPRAPVGKGNAPARSVIQPVRPRRLSHALLFSAKVAQSATFFSDVLGLRVTDRSDDFIVFMHGIHGSDHHMLGIVASEGPGLHHLSWDVASLDEVGLGMEQMLQAGYTKGWGVGRHVLGSNYFFYSRDPWGSFSEFSYDIDFVPSDHDWMMGNHPQNDSFYVWGPLVPEEFVINYEATDAVV